jgi:Arc/MetJ-type ribon-helix-helix transcriptional regulator
MNTQKERTHIVLPTELVAQIDALVGKRGRSRFIAEAAQERLQREHMLKVLDESFGLWKEEDHPELHGAGGTAGWVRRMREADSDRLEALLRV